MSVKVREAKPDDAQMIHRFICDLADYERLRHEVKATPDDIVAGLFGPRPYAEALIAEVDGRPVGFALYFHNFSTFEGKPGIYLEDLFVDPKARGQGIGKALLVRLAQVALERGCARLEWSVLDWNAPSIAFYKLLGARAMDDWKVYRVNGGALALLASSDQDDADS